jgi:hypothetical protein
VRAIRLPCTTWGGERQNTYLASMLR